MAVASRGDGNTGREVEELVAVHVFDDDAATALRHQRIGACIRGRNDAVVMRDGALRVRTGQSSPDHRAIGSESGHQNLRKSWARDVHARMTNVDRVATTMSG